MSRPENGIYIIQGEVNLVVTAMRRNSRWSSHAHQDDEQDPLINSFSRLKDALNTVSDLDELAPNEFLSPFLEVIRSEDTTGPITGLALSSVNKFLSYRLIEPNSASAGTAIENIADAVTHARFVGTDPSSDEVVLMKILHVLRTLLLTPAGTMLTNESVCEIMQSCFRICFEMRLSELLRKSAEHTLMDMVRLLFSRLPFFKEDVQSATNLKKLMKMRPGGMDTSRSSKYKKRSPKPRHRKMPHQRGHSPTPDPSQGVPSSQPAPDAVPHSDHLQAPAPCQDGEEIKDSAASDSVEQQHQAVPESVLTPPESTVTSPEELLDRPVTIATTPVSSNRTVVDIQQGFQKVTEQEETSMETSQDNSVTEDDKRDLECETQHPGDAVEDQQQQQQQQEQHQQQQQQELDKTEEANSSKDNLKADVTELNPEADKVSMTSDLGEEVESIHSVHSVHSVDAGSHEPDYVNPRGVRFTPHQHTRDGSGPLIPYGQPCVRELFRFLITLTNPNDRHNTDVMIHMGLSLLTVALETGADHLASFSSLLSLVKDDL